MAYGKYTTAMAASEIFDHIVQYMNRPLYDATDLHYQKLFDSAWSEDLEKLLHGENIVKFYKLALIKNYKQDIYTREKLTPEQIKKFEYEMRPVHFGKHFVENIYYMLTYISYFGDILDDNAKKELGKSLYQMARSTAVSDEDLLKVFTIALDKKCKLECEYMGDDIWGRMKRVVPFSDDVLKFKSPFKPMLKKD